MTLPQAFLLFIAATLAGALNSVAGGGSFISFPALLFTGVPSKLANTTNTVALWPGSVASVGAYRQEIMAGPRGLRSLLVVSLIGGIIGAFVLLATPQSTFDKLLPFLLLFATLLFAFGRRVSNNLRERAGRMNLPPWVLTVTVIILQLLTSIYGGFFGGGIGIVMLAVLALWGMENIHLMNGLKTLLATCINGVAVIIFVANGSVLWPQAVLMIVGAVLGGYGGAYYARQIDPQKIRILVIVVGSLMTIYFFVRTFLLR
ncbi:MAG: sulfite exporter TauE/SafE family protein [Chloroflexota bacterium]